MWTKRYINSEYFKTWTPNMAYIFGLWCADGHISYVPGRFEYRFTLCLYETDSYLLNEILKIMESTHPLLTYTDRKLSCIDFRNKELVESLLEIGGIPRKSFNLKWPDKLPQELHRDFVRGYFDGDGYIGRDISNNTWKLEVFSASCDFLLKYREVIISEIKNIKVNYRTKQNKSGSILNVITMSADNARRFANYIYDTSCNLYLERKYKLFQEMGTTIISYPKQETGYLKIGCLGGLSKKKLIDDLKSGMSLRAIARKYEVNHHSICNKCKRFGIDYKNYQGGKHRN